MKVIHFSLKHSCACTKITNRKTANQFCRLNLMLIIIECKLVVYIVILHKHLVHKS